MQHITKFKRQFGAFSVARDVTHQLQQMKWAVGNIIYFIQAIQSELPEVSFLKCYFVVHLCSLYANVLGNSFLISDLSCFIIKSLNTKQELGCSINVTLCILAKQFNDFVLRQIHDVLNTVNITWSHTPTSTEFNIQMK